MTIKSKADVEFHSDGYRESRPAVNVKVYGSMWDVPLPLGLGGVASPDPSAPNGWGPIEWQYTDPGFTHEWIEEHVGDNDIDTWEFVTMIAWEQLEEEAKEIWPEYNVKVWSEGRSGGWAVVEGLKDFDSWDALDLNRWARFSKIAKAYADDIPHQMVWSIYANVYERLQEEEEQALALASLKV